MWKGSRKIEGKEFSNTSQHFVQSTFFMAFLISEFAKYRKTKQTFSESLIIINEINIKVYNTRWGNLPHLKTEILSFDVENSEKQS